MICYPALRATVLHQSPMQRSALAAGQARPVESIWRQTGRNGCAGGERKYAAFGENGWACLVRTVTGPPARSQCFPALAMGGLRCVVRLC